MRYSIHSALRRALVPWLTGITLAVSIFSGCATSPSGPNPPDPNTQNTISVDEFFSPPPSGQADDYYMLMPGENDDDFSFFLDEQDFGEHGHMHVHVNPPGQIRVLIGVHFDDWTDSLKLTDTERKSIDTAMRAFVLCADSAINTFRITIQPYRDSFKVQRHAIVMKLDTSAISRDSARKLLDSAIVKYDTATSKLRATFTLEINGCLKELDAFLKTRLTATQYAIWVRHRGW